MKVHHSTRAATAGAGFAAVCLDVGATLPGAALARDVSLEKIVVTAQKREQNLLDHSNAPKFWKYPPK